MIEIIKSSDLKTNTDLVCTYCGVDHSKKDSKEEIDYVFERKGNEEYCICKKCQRECDEKGFY